MSTTFGCKDIKELENQSLCKAQRVYGTFQLRKQMAAKKWSKNYGFALRKNKNPGNIQIFRWNFTFDAGFLIVLPMSLAWTNNIIFNFD